MDKRFTDVHLLSLTKKRLPLGQRADIMDPTTPAFGVRLNDRGKLTFIVVARLPGRSSGSRISLGEYTSATESPDSSKLTLKQAREKFDRWRTWLDDGLDPRQEERRTKLVNEGSADTTFGAVVEIWLKEVVLGPGYPKKPPLQRSGPAAAREVRTELKPLWDKQVAAMRAADIALAIKPISHGVRQKPAHARNILGHVKRFYEWVVAQAIYDVETNPAKQLKPALLVGPKRSRERTLTDAELRAFWSATDGLGYPFGPMLQLLAITGQRLSEIASLSWREVDLIRKQLVIPAARMKGKRDHVVPLPPSAVALLRKIPEFSGGGYVFTTTHGRRPISGFSKAKRRVDAAMVVGLGGADLPQWGFHDLRRTARSGFSPLPFSDTVKERILSHLPRGVHGIYDRAEYLPERRRCLRLWAVHLMRVVGKIRPERNHRLVPQR